MSDPSDPSDPSDMSDMSDSPPKKTNPEVSPGVVMRVSPQFSKSLNSYVLTPDSSFK